jgi:hypothetical protein
VKGAVSLFGPQLVKENIMGNWSKKDPCKNCGKEHGIMVKCENCGTLGCPPCVGISSTNPNRCNVCKKPTLKKKI